MHPIVVLLYFLSICLSLVQVNGMNYFSFVDSMKPYEYLCRFAFYTEPADNTARIAHNGLILNSGEIQAADVFNGFIQYEITFPRYFRPKLLIFPSYGEWAGLSNRSPCGKMVEMATEKIHLAETTGYASYDPKDKIVYSNTAYTSNESPLWKAKGIVFFPELPERSDYYRWGVLYIANCDANLLNTECSNSNNCQGPIVADFQMSLLNGKGATQHLSADETMMFGLVITLGFLQLVNIAGAVHTRLALLKIKKYHVTVRLLVWSIFLEFFSFFFGVIFWGHYMSAGYPVYTWSTLQDYSQALSVYLVIIVLILLGKGWTIVRPALTPSGSLKVIGYGTVYLICIIYAETYVFGYYQFYRMSDYFYSTPSGKMVLVLRCGIAPFWLLYAIQTTMQNFKKKRRFYFRFMIASLTWLFLPAFFVLIANGVSPIDWRVYNVCWESGLLFAAHYTLLLMYNPLANQYNASYPFHQNELSHLTNVLWKAHPNINKEELNESRLMKSEGSAGSGMKYNILGGKVPEHMNIIDVFAAIRHCSQGLVVAAEELLPKVNMFKGMYCLYRRECYVVSVCCNILNK